MLLVEDYPHPLCSTRDVKSQVTIFDESLWAAFLLMDVEPEFQGNLKIQYFSPIKYRVHPIFFSPALFNTRVRKWGLRPD